jgi:hypothetical protein
VIILFWRENILLWQEMKYAFQRTTSWIGHLDWQSPIRALDLSKEILTNPELGLTMTSVPNWTAKWPGSELIHDWS